MKAAFWKKSVLFSIAIFGFAPVTHAGFEWVPPHATTQQQPQVRSVEPSVMAPAPPSLPTPMPAVAMPPVTAEPIMQENVTTMRAPSISNITTSMPRPATPSVKADIRQPIVQNRPIPVSARATGLYINPYPLQGNNMPVENRGVDMSMTEHGGTLTPVQLGGGMTSGVIAPRAPEIQGPIQKTATTANYNRPSSDMTPMIGGEPAPLSLAGVPQNIFGAPQPPVMASPLSAPSRQYAKAVGFGKELPLSLALTQVIPSEYSYRFEGDVNTDTAVSWEGGQSWDTVMQDMLRPHGYRAFIQGNQVVIAPSATL